MTTHFKAGVTNVGGNILTENGALKQMMPTKYYNFLDDFNNYTAGAWVVTDTGTGTSAVIDGAGGQFAITNAAAGASDTRQMQWSGTSAGARLTVFWDATKDFQLSAKVKVSNITTAGWMVGAATVDTSLLASLPTDGIYFLKANGAASLIASTRKAGTSSSITLGNVVADTYNTMSLMYTAVDGIWRAFLDGAPIGSITTTTNTPTNGLSVSVALLNSAATAHLVTVDWLSFMVER